jgi:hypothetical protein
LGRWAISALVGAACGGDEALSKDEYIAQGNAICEDGNVQLEAIILEFFADLPEESTPEEFAELFAGDFIDQFTAAIEGQLADLRDLAAPEGDENLLAALYDDVEAVMDELNRLADDAAAGDPAAIERLAARETDEDPSHGSLRVAATSFDEVDMRAIEYGLTVCGE